MKIIKYAIDIIFLFQCGVLFSQIGVINQGANIVMKGDVTFDLGKADNDFVNRDINNANYGTIDLDGNILLKGNWINDVSHDVFINENKIGNIIFEGDIIQTIGGNYMTNFESIELKNPSGIELQNDISISNTLSLNEGRISLLAYNLTLHENAQIAGTFSANRLILADGTGTMQKVFSTTGESFLFPVGNQIGKNYFYSPVNFTVNSGTLNTDPTISVNLKSEKLPENESDIDFLNRYWNLNQSGFGSINYDADFHYLDTDVSGNEQNLYGAKYNGVEMELYEPANSTSNILSFNGLTSFSEFTGVDGAAPVLLSFSPPDNEIGVSHSTDLFMEFNENIFKNSGNISIRKVNDDNSIAEIDVNNTAVEVYENEVTVLNSLFEFVEGTEYYVNIDDGAFTDANFNAASGIYNNYSWSFTANASPTIIEIPDQSIELENIFSDINLDEYVYDDLTIDENIIWTTSTTINLTINILNRIAYIDINDSEWYGTEIVNFFATDEEGLSSSYEVTFTITPIGIFSANLMKSLKVYPNPNNGLFYIDVNNSFELDLVFDVYNSQGVKIDIDKVSLWEISNNNHKYVLNLDNCPTGIYFLRVQDKYENAVYKIIKE